MYKSNLNPMFRNQFAETIFNQKYKHDGCLTWAELAKTLIDDVCKDKLNADEHERLIQYVTDMKFIPGGRYLYYAGRPKKFFNNCYLLRALEDTREDWADLSKRAETCLATGGGIGIDYSIYRASGSILHGTGGIASGPIAKMLMINEIGRQIMQGGSRRSAIYASLNWRHGDVKQFLKVKNWKDYKIGNQKIKDGEVERPYTMWDAKQEDFNFQAPLDMTNISINYDTKWLMEYWTTGNVGEVFLENVRQALSTAEPGFSFNFFDKESETLRNACVPGDTLILTDAGHTPILDRLNLSTVVWNGNDWSSVTPFSTGINDTVIVKLSDNTSLRCTPYHKFILDNGDRIEAENLKPGDSLAKFKMPILSAGEEYSTDAYSQGFYSGDGNRGYTWSWIYDTKYCCIERLKGQIQDTCYPTRKVWKHGPMLDKAFVPVNGNVAYCLQWLAGICDTDGTVSYNPNSVSLQISSIDYAFLDRIRLMLNRLGCQPKLNKSREEGYRSLPDGRGGEADFLCQQGWRLLISSTDTALLKELGFKPSRLDISKATPQRDARRFVKVVSIEESEPCETFCFTEPKNNSGTFNGIVTAQCTEVTSSDDSDVCNLGSVNLSRIASISEFADVCNLATKFLVCGTLVADLPYSKVGDVRTKNRRLGLGLMGIHEWLIQRDSKYEVTPELHRYLAIYRDISRATANMFCNKLSISTPIACRAIAPTGTIGILAGTTTGIEPLFAVAYKRRYLRGLKWHYQYVVDGAAQELANLYGKDPDTMDSAISLANDYERRIKFQADVQDYVDMAISSTINLPSWGSPLNNEDKILSFAQTLAKYAHRLRGFTCYPDGSRGGQPLTPVSYKEAKEKLGTEFEESIEMHDICDITSRGGVCGA